MHFYTINSLDNIDSGFIHKEVRRFVIIAQDIKERSLMDMVL